MSGESVTSVVRPRRQRPTTWYVTTENHSQYNMPSLAAGSKGMSSVESLNPFHAPPSSSFRSPFANKGKHKLSPSPSPRNNDYDFLISSPRPPLAPLPGWTPNRSGHDSDQQRSSSPVAESPTPACGMGTAVEKLRLHDDDSPIRHVPGHSRSLAAARGQSGEDLFSPRPRRHMQESPDSPSLLIDDDEPALMTPAAPPQPALFTLRPSHSETNNNSSSWSMGSRSRIPRLNITNALRRGSKDRGGLPQKKPVSLGDLQVDKMNDSPFGAAFIHARKARSSLGNTGRHRRSSITDRGEQSISRSIGHKSGLSLSLSSGLPPPELSHSNTSISSLSTSSSSTTPPITSTPRFEDVKPNPEVFEAASSGFSLKQKFRPRDSFGSNASFDHEKMPPPSVIRPSTMAKSQSLLIGSSVKRARSLGGRNLFGGQPAEGRTSGEHDRFDFLCDGVSSFGFQPLEEKPSMPDTPVKRHSFTHTHGSAGRMSLSNSLPAMPATADMGMGSSMMLPPSTRKPPALVVTMTSSPGDCTDTDQSSPSNRLGSSKKPTSLKEKRASLGLLRRVSDATEGLSSEEDSTPTKGTGGRSSLARELFASQRVLTLANEMSPSPARFLPASVPRDAGVIPRLSLPEFTGSTKDRADRARRMRHRQSHPVASPILPVEEDIFESRFVVMNPLGKGAFSSVLQVKERYGDGVYAVKKTRGVFDGIKDRLRHLEEVDILRLLSKNPNDHVIKFEDAWEQNRQLYIQTEACVGSLAAFLQVYGHENERLDEGRVWKMVRDLADGLNHLHSNGVIHFDIKPDNILVGADRSLKIADFGLATRWPRVSPAEIIAGSGLGGSIGDGREEKLEREGDRVYMPPEMLRGVFVMAADIFSFGLVILESAMNIYLPDGGAGWHALRENNFSWLDLSPLSSALVDLITNCLSSNPDSRPTIQTINEHPIVKRSWSGGPALAPEDPRWLHTVLAGYAVPPTPLPRTITESIDGEGDVVMGDA